MSELLVGWIEAPLESLVTFSIGGIWGSPPDSGAPDTTTVAVMRGADYRSWATCRAAGAAIRRVPLKAAESRRLEVGNLVIEVSGGGPTQPVGRVVLIDDAALQSTNLPLVLSNFCRRAVLSSDVNPQFVYYQLLHKYLCGDTGRFQTATTNIRNLNFKKYLAETMLVVAPREEQERVVAAIEEQFSRLDAALAALERARQNLKRMKTALLSAAVSGGLMETNSDKWEFVPLGQLLLDIHAGKSFRCEERPASLDEWGVIKVSAMTWGEFRPNENKTVLADREIDSRMEIRSGDLLVSRANTVDYVGAVVHVCDCRPRLLLSDKSLRLTVGPRVLPEWLVVVLRSPVGREYIERVATGTSDSMRNISQPKLRSLTVPVPSISMQRRLTGEVDRQMSLITKLESEVTERRKSAESLRSSILDAAFSGTLVSQDPNNEPASASLERITAQLASSNGHKSTKARQRRRKAAA